MVHISDQLTAGRTLSFEFFPPKSEEAQRTLEKTLAELSELEPSFVSVTCGAGGLTHDRTRDIVVDITGAYGFPAMAHLTCVGNSEAEIRALLADYQANGVTNVLALAGDPPADGSDPGGDFTYAIDLVDLVRSAGDFCVGVAAHPEIHPRSPDRRSDRDHLARKLEVADFAITQFFFDVALYESLLEDLDARGVSKPIVPGLFPVTAPKTVRRFAGMNNTAVPEDLFAELEAAEGDDRLRMAVDAATELGQALLDAGAPGLHVYTMNQSTAARMVRDNLGL